jgi:hypothetical protein
MLSKHYMFSSRTTKEGLKVLNQLKREKGLSWDDFILDAMSNFYGLDKSVLALAKAEPKSITKRKGKVQKKAKKVEENETSSTG